MSLDLIWVVTDLTYNSREKEVNVTFNVLNLSKCQIL